MSVNVGTTQDFVISNALPGDIKSVDSFAKVNIMTEAHDKLEDSVPQIMLSQTTNDQIKVWNGDRLTINYASAKNGSYFGISEVTGTYRNRLNFEVFGENNVFQGTVTGTYDNTWIYSKYNRISNNDNGMSFINSNYNISNSIGVRGINFLNSHSNNLLSNYYEGTYSYTNDISLYASDYNTFRSTFSRDENNLPKSNCQLKNILLLDSNNNFIKGKTNDYNSTFINTHYGMYEFNSDMESLTLIGDKYGYVTDVSGGNIIGIGQGLLQASGNSDKIILGFFNKNSTNPDEILIVGDGKLNDSYKNSLISTNWYSDETKHRDLVRAFSGDGATGKDSNYYRHNIFTVNKNGYITISDYRVPSNSARYGYKGITAYVNGNKYDIPFEEVYHKINGNDSIDMMQETLDSYTKQLQTKLDSIPTLRYETFEDPADLNTSIKTSAYLNVTAPSEQGAIQIPYIEDYINNTILNISYQPNVNATNKRLPAVVVWSYYLPTEHGIPTNKIIGYTEIYPYCSKQFIISKPLYPLDYNTAKPFSGYNLIEQESDNGLTINYDAPIEFADIAVHNTATNEWYNGSTQSYTHVWKHADYYDPSYISTFGHPIPAHYTMYQGENEGYIDSNDLEYIRVVT